MNPFSIYCLISIVSAVIWTLLLVKSRDADRKLLIGVSGAWIATLVLAALWRAEDVPWLWVGLKGVLFVWLVAVVLIAIGAVAAWRTRQPARRLFLLCSLLGIAVNAAAWLHFLWIATTSPGGV